MRAYRETVPEHIDTAVARALARLPADRFGTAGEFAEALAADHAMAEPTPAVPLRSGPPSTRSGSGRRGQ
ncbi:MAG: hypothetical protein ACRENP_24540 [Longimicrobiales bacterium]